MQVRVCNFRSNEFANDFKSSLIDTGFAVITHHGIDFDFIRKTQQLWREFFLKDINYKKEFINLVNSNYGYKGMKTEKALGSEKADLKQFYHWRPGQHAPYEVKDVTAHMFARLEDLGMQMLKVLGWDECCNESDNTILRAIHYPAMDFNSELGAVRAAAHEDINFLTLLVAASAPGLQVKDKEGNWHSVPHEENSIVVNVGDQLQLASNGLYKSTTHRVVNPPDSLTDRISIPLFMHPSSNTLLSEGITAQQFLEERIRQIYTK